MKAKIKIVCPCCIWEEEPDEVGDQILEAIVPVDGEVLLHLFDDGTFSINPKFTCKRCGCGFQIMMRNGRWGIDDHEPQCAKGRRMDAAEEKAFQEEKRQRVDW